MNVVVKFKVKTIIDHLIVLMEHTLRVEVGPIITLAIDHQTSLVHMSGTRSVGR